MRVGLAHIAARPVYTASPRRPSAVVSRTVRTSLTESTLKVARTLRGVPGATFALRSVTARQRVVAPSTGRLRARLLHADVLTVGVATEVDKTAYRSCLYAVADANTVARPLAAFVVRVAGDGAALTSTRGVPAQRVRVACPPLPLRPGLVTTPAATVAERLLKPPA